MLIDTTLIILFHFRVVVCFFLSDVRQQLYVVRCFSVRCLSVNCTFRRLWWWSSAVYSGLWVRFTELYGADLWTDL